MTTAYECEVQTAPGRKGAIQIENRSPVLTDQEQSDRRRCIEEELFVVFSRYERTSR